MKDTEGANLKKHMVQYSPVLLYLPLRVLVEVLPTHISWACQHNMETPGREALSKGVTVLYLVTAGSPAKTAFLTVSWQLWMECAYVEGRRDRRGNDVGLLENTCIITFTSGSFLQMTCTIQRQIALYIFFPLRLWFSMKPPICGFSPKFLESEMIVKSKKDAGKLLSFSSILTLKSQLQCSYLLLLLGIGSNGEIVKGFLWCSSKQNCWTCTIALIKFSEEGNAFCSWQSMCLFVR